MDCIFCKIISGEIPSYKIYEDEKSLAFLDIGPVSHGHALIVPKKHYTNFEEISEEDLCHVIMTVKKIGKAIKESLSIEGYNVTVNNDPIAGQIVPHLHFHIIPRVEGDGLKLWAGGEYKEGEALTVAEKIKKQLI
jgi:histidine triad (HIT) family protein